MLDKLGSTWLASLATMIDKGDRDKIGYVSSWPDNTDNLIGAE